MKASSALFLVMAACLAGCGDKSSQTTTQTTNAASPASGSPLSAPADYLGAVAGAQKRAIKTLDLASLNQAIQMFKVQEGRAPTNLDELIATELIHKVPDAPYGMKIVYDPAAGTVAVVSQ